MTFYISESTLKQDCIFSEPHVYTIPLTTTTLIGDLNPELFITIRIPDSVKKIYNFINKAINQKSNISILLLHKNIDTIEIDNQLLKVVSFVNVVNAKCEEQIKKMSPNTETVNLNAYIDKCEELKKQINSIVDEINKFETITRGEPFYEINKLNSNYLTDLEYYADILKSELKEIKRRIDIHNTLIK